MSKHAEPQIPAGRESGRRRPRGYDLDWNPYAKTRVLLGQVLDVLDEYEDHLPLTVRQIFYRLVATVDYPKDEKAYARLAEMLVRARRARKIPFDMIRDDGVVTMDQDWYGSVEDFHDETSRRIKRYRRNRQEGQPEYIELWCEAAGMLQQLERIASAFSVPVYSCGGFASLTANYDIAERALKRDKPTLLLHVGDFDPSGESIFSAMAEDAAAFVEADRMIFTQEIDAVRVALTEHQVAEYDLPTVPPKASDGRSKTWEGETCQLEALAPDQLAELVRDAIWANFDSHAFSLVREREREDKAELLGLPSGD